METHVILHNIRSVYNVGSIFRTADGAGVSEIILTGYTPLPTDRFGRVRKDFKKVSLGAEAHILWNVAEDIIQTIQELQKNGVYVVGVEQTPQATSLERFKPKEQTAYIFGNEVEGLPSDILQAADAVVEIPMQGKKESLNVAVAAGIVLFQK